jgi:hypothetical protein
LSPPIRKGRREEVELDPTISRFFFLATARGGDAPQLFFCGTKAFPAVSWICRGYYVIFEFCNVLFDLF